MRQASKICGLAAFLALSACNGVVGDPNASPFSSGGPGSAVGPGGSGTGVQQDPAVCKNAQPDPGPAYLRRLTRAEYGRTVRDVLGLDPTTVVATFPEDIIAGGFDNNASIQTISLVHAQQYLSAAKQLSHQVLRDAATIARVLGCDPASGDRTACTKAFVQKVGRRAYRRPLADDEVSALVALSATETDAHEGAALALGAMLQSPSFLWRVEIGTPDRDRPGLVRLTGHELATRLSFFLLGTTPSDALLDAADTGKLDTPDGVAQMTETMLGTPELPTAMHNFTSQWFRADKLPTLQRSTQIYPTFKPELVAAMSEELSRLLDDFMWKDGTSFLDVFTARYTYANDQLAALYGVTAPAGSSFARLDWGASTDRGGLLTTAAFLMGSTRNEETSPIQRGHYIRDVVLCDPLPAPPPGIVPPAIMPGESEADAQQRHSADPLCASCHKRLDPVGNGIERYDAIGALRSTYQNGKPVRTVGHIEGIEAPDYSGGVELGRAVHDAAKTRACVVDHTFRWALGRLEQDEDFCSLVTLGDQFQTSGFSYTKLVGAFVASDAFRYRRAETP